MIRRIRRISFAFLTIAALPGIASVAAAQEPAPAAQDSAPAAQDSAPAAAGPQRAADLVVFVREGCPHCAAAKRWLEQLQRERPGLVVSIREISRDPVALRNLELLSRLHGIAAPGVPTFLVAGELRVGFDRPDTTGREIVALLERQAAERAAAAIAADNPADTTRTAPAAPAATRPSDRPSPPTPRATAPARSDTAPEPPAPVPADSTRARSAADTAIPVEAASPTTGDSPDTTAAPVSAAAAARVAGAAVELPLVGRVQLEAVGLPLFTVAIGLLDGFNPCAMWVLLFLLSVLVGLRSRSRMFLIGGIFVLVSGLVYFAFMAAWLNVFLLIGMSRGIQLALGGIALALGTLNVKDFFAFGAGVSLGIPERAKPGIYARARRILTAENVAGAMTGVVVLAALVNTVELLCTAGLPALYTQILTLRELPAWAYYGYLTLYNVFYMFDDALMLVIAVVTLSHHRLQQREARWLKLIAGGVMVVLGAVLIFQPGLLAA